MPKIPLYMFKPLEELARAVLVAVLAYAVTAVVTDGLPDSAETWRALAAGALPIAIAALRSGLNKTPLTPDGGLAQLPPMSTPTGPTPSP